MNWPHASDGQYKTQRLVAYYLIKGLLPLIPSEEIINILLKGRFTHF